MTARPFADVPCNGCTACCHDEIVPLCPQRGDVIAEYQHDTHDRAALPHGALPPDMPPGPVAILKWKPNRECIYLGDGGCTIHGRAPFMCRVFDCRRWYRALSPDQHASLSTSDHVAAEILTAGRERLRLMKLK